MSKIVHINSNGQTAADYTFALQQQSTRTTATSSGKEGDFKGVMYYMEPRFKLVPKDAIVDYHFYTNKFNCKNLVLPISCVLTDQLKKIAAKCLQELTKLESNTGKGDIEAVFNDRSLFLKINRHLLAEGDIPDHRLIRVCVDVYGLCVVDKKAYLQCEVSEWKVESVL